MKPLICVAKYNFGPSILKYSHFFLGVTEREWCDYVLTDT